jgi:hypothetical protein
LYRYMTGVPWAAPQLGAVTADAAVYGTASLPMDGGVPLTVHGVGFARSPFLKCALVQHDPVGQFTRSSEMGSSAVAAVVAGEYGTHWATPPAEAYVASAVGADSLEVTSQATTTAASVTFTKWAAAPRIRSDFESGMDIAWDATNEYTRAVGLCTLNQVDP